MHHTRLSSIVIDCDDLAAGVRFWSQALGSEPLEQHGPYVFLKDTRSGLYIGVQEVPEPKTCKTRVHFDILTDDLDAEVSRLEGLGARRCQKVKSWWVMQDPCGNEFCVIGTNRTDLAEDEGIQTWP